MLDNALSFVQGMFAAVRAALLLASVARRPDAGAAVAGLAAMLALLEAAAVFADDPNTGLVLCGLEVAVGALCSSCEEPIASTTCGFGAYVCAAFVALWLSAAVLWPSHDSIVGSALSSGRALHSWLAVRPPLEDADRAPL